MTRRHNKEYSQDTVNFSLFFMEKEFTEDNQAVNIILKIVKTDWNIILFRAIKKNTMSQYRQPVESSKVRIYLLNVDLWVFLASEFKPPKEEVKKNE